ncbi:CYTH domain-containing protein [Cellulomonas rhizosphaerae]|uniref:CYTH domain-containing protein n=1 Tax=Cellulomonas rhizosphaerae TaxID=2293719 RepID=A0A413RL28_9CELL|nr:hypothetical protein [Cellulomonas rhizosphaerae]RHA40303.1 hypothetical protein D1825_10375 [Cellulomonas rhizosphaerae]
MASRFELVERERRFLAPGPPPADAVVATRTIHDRYLDGTRLRVRLMMPGRDGTDAERKLTQKVPGAPWGTLTTIYLSADEHAALASLPAATLSKTRLSVPPLGYDVFDGHLAGLVLAEVEFDSDESAARFVAPPGLVEVTHDERFTGGRLVRASSDEVRGWISSLR